MVRWLLSLVLAASASLTVQPAWALPKSIKAVMPPTINSASAQTHAYSTGQRKSAPRIWHPRWWRIRS